MYKVNKKQAHNLYKLLGSKVTGKFLGLIPVSGTLRSLSKMTPAHGRVVRTGKVGIFTVPAATITSKEIIK